MTYKDPITPTSYFVLDGDTLLYQFDVFKGKEDLQDRYHIVTTRSTFRRDGDMVFVKDCNRLREATLEDFDKFRVCPKGHLMPVK